MRKGRNGEELKKKLKTEKKIMVKKVATDCNAAARANLNET